MRTAVIVISLLAAASAAWAQALPWPNHPGYHMRVESVLLSDRWRGVDARVVESMDLRQRIQLDVFLIQPQKPGRVRLDGRLDLEVFSALGPSRDQQRFLPDARRPAFDLHAAHFFMRDLGGVFDLTLGRHTLSDPLGFDALDGATATLRALPYLALDASAGLAARRAWSDFGPDLFTPDGVALEDHRGTILGGAISTQQIDWLYAKAAWRRHFDDRAVQRELAGASLSVRPLDGLRLDCRLRYDLIFEQTADLATDLRWRTGFYGLGAGWKRVRPVFSADSIWNAFSVDPYHATRLFADVQHGPWRLDVDGELRIFDTEDDGRSHDIGLRFQRTVMVQSRAGHIGAEARLGSGYGGARHYADAFANIPLPARPGSAPVYLRARLGAAQLTQPTMSRREGALGWGLLAATWRAAESIRLEASAEAHTSAHTPFRMQGWARIAFEDWW